jgi:CubicO group peptidase (beta-lactamase class C family)
VAGPLGLGVAIGVGEDDQANVQRLVATGEPPTAEQLAALGVPDGWDPGEVVNENLVVLNDPANLALGVPAAGGVGTAADVAMFYQALLANPGGLFDPDVLTAGTAEVFSDLPDPLLGIPALRTLGLYLAGGDGHSALRGFGRTVSAGTFGHAGAGGQIAWADPDTGISFVYLTNGLDAFVPNQWARQAALSNRAGALAGGQGTPAR